MLAISEATETNTTSLQHRTILLLSCMIDPSTLPTAADRPTLAELEPLARVALKYYGITATRLQNLRYFNNATYRVVAPDGQQFVLRVTCNHHSEARLRSEMQWLSAMQSIAGACVPNPVASLDGQLVVQASVSSLSDPRWCNVFHWLDGTHIVEEEMSAADFRAMGGACADLHAKSATFNPPPGFDRPHWDEEYFVDPGAGNTIERITTYLRRHVSLEAANRFVQLATQARELMGRLRPDLLSYGLIHADFHPGNCLFRPNGVAFVDFEDLGSGYFLYDIASALFGSLERHDYLRLTEAFTKAYAGTRPLPSDFSRQLLLFQLLRAVILTHLVLAQGELDGNAWWEGYLIGKLRQLLVQRTAVGGR